MTPWSTIFLAILTVVLIAAILLVLLTGTGITAWKATRKPRPGLYPTIEWDQTDLNDLFNPRIPRVRA